MHSLSRSVLAFCRAATLLAAGASRLLALASARGAEPGIDGLRGYAAAPAAEIPSAAPLPAVTPAHDGPRSPAVPAPAGDPEPAPSATAP